MNDKFTKFILAGILLCLIIIAGKPTNNQVALPNFLPNPNFSLTTSGEEVIQLAPNRIAVKGNYGSGFSGTILVFDFDNNTKKFNYVGSMNYMDYFNNASKYGIPTNIPKN